MKNLIKLPNYRIWKNPFYPFGKNILKDMSRPYIPMLAISRGVSWGGSFSKFKFCRVRQHIILFIIIFPITCQSISNILPPMITYQWSYIRLKRHFRNLMNNRYRSAQPSLWKLYLWTSLKSFRNIWNVLNSLLRKFYKIKFACCWNIFYPLKAWNWTSKSILSVIFVNQFPIFFRQWEGITLLGDRWPKFNACGSEETCLYVHRSYRNEIGVNIGNVRYGTLLLPAQ